MEAVLSLLMFVGLFAFILSGLPVAFALAGVGLLFGVIAISLGSMSLISFNSIPTRIYGSLMQNVTLMAVPLFIFMGLVLERSKLASELLTVMAYLLRKWRSGLALSIVLVGGLLAASTGIVGATVVTMAILSLPSMIKQGYSKELATGTVCAAGTLGQIIPPSIVLVLLGDIMNVDVGNLFVGAMLPGTILVVGYMAYIIYRISFSPGEKNLSASPSPAEGSSGIDGSLSNSSRERESPLKKSSGEIIKVLVPPGLLVGVVLGSILGGIASPTEAAGCGALGGIFIAAFRRRLDFKILVEVAKDTVKMTAMVFTILIGSQVFSLTFRLLGGDEVIANFINNLELSKYVVVGMILVLIFLLGFFLDFLEICFIVLPIVVPLLAQLGFHTTEELLVFAILVAINLQTSFLTPPFGFSLFYLKGVAPPEIKTQHIYRGVMPYVVIQLLVLLLLVLCPGLITWLPTQVFGVI